MKIERIEPHDEEDRPAFLDNLYKLTLSGEELIRLWSLSFFHEGGGQHEREQRFARFVVEVLEMDDDALEAFWERFSGGKYK